MASSKEMMSSNFVFNELISIIFRVATMQVLEIHGNIMEILVHMEKYIEKKVFEKKFMKIQGKLILNVLQEVTFFYILFCILSYLDLPRSRLYLIESSTMN